MTEVYMYMCVHACACAYICVSGNICVYVRVHVCVNENMYFFLVQLLQNI